MPNLQPRIGGSFAPPLSDELLTSYKEMCDGLEPSAVKDAMHTLLNCCGVWWGLPEPEGTAKAPHGSGVGTMVSLHADHAKALDEHIPWDHEIDSIQNLLDTIDPVEDRDLRNACFHLLWHTKELSLGREPITNDKL